MTSILNTFQPVDWLVFAMSLAVSVAIAIFFAIRGGRNTTQGEYLLANRKMPILPVALSIQVSYMSAILILGTPAEMYTQGVQYFMSTFGICLGILLATTLIVPLLYPLGSTSVFEYLELRFQSVTVRLVGTFLTVFTQVCYMGVASFAPSTALEAVTGFPVWASILLINGLTTLYTTIGGIKGVIWTDVFQAFIMLMGMLAILIQGTIRVGGLDKVWRINDQYGRLTFFDFDPDPTQRHSFWSLVVGSGVTWFGTYGVYQTSFQRYSTLPSMRHAKTAMLLNIPGAIFFYVIACFSGLVVFAYYVTENCDILSNRLVSNPNQIVPFFVMETLAYPAVPGLFLASLFAGALSSISSALNALAALTWEDVLKRHLESRWSEHKKMVFTKVLVVLFGCLSTMVGVIVQNMEGTVVQLVVGLLGTGTGPMAGMFLLGAVFPWANAAGAAIGGLTSFGVSLWFSIGAYETGLPRDRFKSPNGTCHQYRPDDTASMTTATMVTDNATISPGQALDGGVSGIQEMYSVSYLWYSSIGLSICVILGLIISFVTGPNSLRDIPTKYQIPLATRLLCCLPRSWQRTLNCDRRFESVVELECQDNHLEDQGRCQRHCEDNNGPAYGNHAYIMDHLPGPNTHHLSDQKTNHLPASKTE